MIPFPGWFAGPGGDFRQVPLKRVPPLTGGNRLQQSRKESRLNLGLFFEREKSKWEIGLLQRYFPTDPRFFPTEGMLRDIAGRGCGQVP